MLSDFGLALYVLATLIGFVGLLFDLTLKVRGRVTITEWATEKPWREWSLIVGVFLGSVGFALHFLTFGR